MRIWEHPLAMVATGVVVVVFGVYTRVQSLRSRSWPTVTGVITESYVSYYDPRDPASAVLDPGTGPTPGLALLAGVGCFSYAFWRARMA
jgi:hypothetical protein